MEALFALAIPAIVKAFELFNEKKWASLGKIVLSALLGLGAGYLGIAGLDLVSGLGAGLSASGLMTVAGYVRPKATVQITN